MFFMSVSRSLPVLLGVAVLSLSACTDWGYTDSRIINKEDQMERTTGTRTAVDTRTNKLYKIYTTTDPNNVGVNNPVRTSDAPAQTDKK
jgi:hypothetical protein